MGYTPAGQALYDEALRVVPGIMAAKNRVDYIGAKVLLDGYFEQAKCAGIRQQDAWQLLFNASMHWCSSLLGAYSTGAEQEPVDVIRGMAAKAALWRSDAADPA